MNRLKNRIDEVLGNQLDQEKMDGRPVRLIRARIVVKGVKMLFHELVKEICHDSETDTG